MKHSKIIFLILISVLVAAFTTGCAFKIASIQRR